MQNGEVQRVGRAIGRAMGKPIFFAFIICMILARVGLEARIPWQI